MDEKPADGWWNTFEINVLGVYNTIRPAAKYLRKTDGYFIATSSLAAQLRWPGGSDYEVCRVLIFNADMLTDRRADIQALCE